MWRSWRFQLFCLRQRVDAQHMDEKATLRRSLMAARKAHHAEVGQAAALALTERLADLALPAAQTIAAYLPLGSEIDCRPLVAALRRAGHYICLPVCETYDAPMLFRSYEDDMTLEDDAIGMAVPPSGAPPCRPDIVLLPLVGFDAKGTRLGRGGGYYDRTLAELRRNGLVGAYGLAYDMQMVDKCPAAPHDQALDAVLSETALHRFQRG